MERAYRQGLPLSMERLLAALQNCKRRNDVTPARVVHCLISDRDLKSSGVLENHLIRLYASYGSLLESNLVFCTADEPSVYTWHAIISSYSMHGCHDTTLTLFYRMQEDGIEPGRCTFLCVLKSCTSRGDVAQCMLVHDQVISSAFESDLTIGSALINMYFKLGDSAEASIIFKNLHDRDLVCWNSMITGYVETGQNVTALNLFEEMKQEGIIPDRAVFLCIFKACGNLKAIRQGRLMHSQLMEDIIEADEVLCTMLVDMYAKCGSIEDAQRVFHSLKRPDVVSWSALLAAYNQYECWRDTICLFYRMQACGIQPDKVTILSVLKAWGNVSDTENVAHLHEMIVEEGLESDMSIQNALINMYVKIGNAEDAHGMFDRLQKKCPMVWNMMLAGYARNGRSDRVLTLYYEMLSEGIDPNKYTYVHILKACSVMQDIEQAKLMHEKVISSGLQYDITVASCLIDMYVKFECIEIGCQIFRDLPEKNLVTWNSIIAGCTQHGYDLTAFELFEEMENEGMTPDYITFSCIARACGNKRDLILGRQIHNKIISSGGEPDAFVGSSIMDMYAECGSMEDLQTVFDKVQEKNVVCWNIIIGQYVQLKRGFEALQLYENMQQDGIDPDSVTFLCILKACDITARKTWHWVNIVHDLILKNGIEYDIAIASALVDTYAKTGNLEAASKMFDSIFHPNVVTWNSMISGYAEQEKCLTALDLFRKMLLAHVEPDRSTFFAALKACAITGAIQHSRIIHDEIIKCGLELDVIIGSAIVDVYAKCGSLLEAEKVLEFMPDRDLVCWNALIAGFAHHGDNKRAEQCFHKIQSEGIKPAHGSFTSVLAACSHAGRMDEGCNHFTNMKENQQTLLHYTCMIDLLGRSGCIEQAVEMLETMPNLPDTVVWLALLTACRKYGNTNLGKECFIQLCQSDINVSSGYMLISDIWARCYSLENCQDFQELQGFDGCSMNSYFFRFPS